MIELCGGGGGGGTQMKCHLYEPRQERPYIKMLHNTELTLYKLALNFVLKPHQQIGRKGVLGFFRLIRGQDWCKIV